MKSQLPKTSVVAIPTRLGAFTAHFTARGLSQLQFPSERKSSARAANRQKRSAWEQQLARQLNDYFDGGNARFTVPLDIQGGTEFQRNVWREMKTIPASETRSYKELASRIGKPAAIRAVGGACGANPIPILIPCHRVVASDGSLGGFSGGLHWKKKLLALEKRQDKQDVCPTPTVLTPSLAP